MNNMTQTTRNETWKKVQLGDPTIAKTASGGTPNRSDPEFFSGDIYWVKKIRYSESNGPILNLMISIVICSL